MSLGSHKVTFQQQIILQQNHDQTNHQSGSLAATTAAIKLNSQ